MTRPPHIPCSRSRCCNGPTRGGVVCVTTWMTLVLATLAGCSMETRKAQRLPDAETPTFTQLPTMQEGDRLWVIARHPEARAQTEEASPVGQTTAHLHLAAGHRAPLPVEHVRLHVMLGSSSAQVEIHQRLTNPYDEAGEVTYRFVLPEAARIEELVMVIGQRRIRGVIRDAEEAAALYRQAREHGLRASLLHMDEPGAFTHRLARIEPGAAMGVELRYRQAVETEANRRRFALPAALVHGVLADSRTDANDPRGTLTVALGPGLNDLEVQSAHERLPAAPSNRRDAQASDGTAPTPVYAKRVVFGQPLGDADLLLHYRVDDAQLAGHAAGASKRRGTLDDAGSLITVDAVDSRSD